MEFAKTKQLEQVPPPRDTERCDHDNEASTVSSNSRVRSEIVNWVVAAVAVVRSYIVNWVVADVALVRSEIVNLVVAAVAI